MITEIWWFILVVAILWAKEHYSVETINYHKTCPDMSELMYVYDSAILWNIEYIERSDYEKHKKHRRFLANVNKQFREKINNRKRKIRDIYDEHKNQLLEDIESGTV